MNRLQILALCFLASLPPLFFAGCAFDGPQYPTTYAPTATPVPAVVNIVSSTYNPAAVTITRGNSVIWTNLVDGISHSVYTDNGAGACATNFPLAAGASLTLTFPSPITINYHCQYHSSCGLSTCGASCTGMVGTVVVQ